MPDPHNHSDRDLLEGFNAEDTRILREARARQQAQVLAETKLIPFDIIPPVGEYRCKGIGRSCQELLELPGICAACGGLLDRRERVKLLAPASASIPEHFRWAVWGNRELDARVGAQVVVFARKKLALPRSAVILGRPGLGKTSLACAALRGLLDAAPDRADLMARARGARFIAAWNLGPEAKLEILDVAALLRQAIEAPLLVLDDLGSELGGALPGTGLCAQRSAPISRVLLERHNASRDTLVTTSMGDDEIAAIYGPVYRRIMDPGRAVRIDLGRFAPPERLVAS